MKRSVNNITLVGTVGRHPEAFDQGKAVALSVGTDRPPGKAPSPSTDWHRVMCRDDVARFVKKYVNAGDRVYIEGSLAYDSYERADGVIVPTAEIHANVITLM